MRRWPAATRRSSPAPDAHPASTSAAGLRDLAALARGALCEVAAVAALTVGAAGTQLAPMSELADLGVRLFGDPGAGAQDPALLRRALQYAGDLGVVIVQPAVASALAGAGCMHEGEWSSRLGLAGVPAEAEESAVMQLVALARSVGTAVHVRGVSTAASLAMVTAARRGGIRITADVAPAHALLTDAVLAGVVPAYDGGRRTVRSAPTSPTPTGPTTHSSASNRRCARRRTVPRSPRHWRPGTSTC